MANNNGICTNCLLLTFDPENAVEAANPWADEDDDASTNEDYGFVPLRYRLEDDYPPLPVLSASIQRGCSICDFIRHVFRSHINYDPELREVADEALALYDQDLTAPTLKIALQLDEYHPEPGTVRFGRGRSSWRPSYMEGTVTVGMKVRPIRIHVRDRQLGFFRGFPQPNPLSNELVQLVQGLIDDCSTPSSLVHKRCPKSKQAVAPLRLLEVGHGDVVRLVSTEGSTLQYAILSYCWGTSASVLASRTVPSNLSARLSGFALSSLPATIQDSVAVARALRIPYLWVDALCIVQNSDEWSTESLRMMQYYQNAIITIAPIICGSADEPFLVRRQRYATTEIHWPALPGLAPGAGARKLQFYFPEYRDLDTVIDESAWASRGWTFQELQLSSRVLYFTRHGAKFTCRGGSAIEGRHLAIKAEVDYALRDFLPISPDQTHTTGDWGEWGSTEMVRDKWYKCVTRYALRQLTFETDRLLALSGVASKFAELLGRADTYRDGFWEADLLHGLLWSVAHPQAKPASLRPRVEEASSFPSWSWCSAAGQSLTWQDGIGSKPAARLLNLVTRPEGSRPNTGPKITHLEVTAWIFPSSLLEAVIPSGLEVNVYLDESGHSGGDSEAAREELCVILTVYFHGEDNRSWESSPSADPHDISGLVIRPTGRHHAHVPTYRRYGMFVVEREVEVLDAGTSNSSSTGEASLEEAGDCGKFDLAPVLIDEYPDSDAAKFYRRIYSKRATIALE